MRFDKRKEKLRKQQLIEGILDGSTTVNYLGDLYNEISSPEKDSVVIEFDKSLLDHAKPAATVSLEPNSVVRIASDSENDTEQKDSDDKPNMLLWGVIILIAVMLLIFALKQFKVI